MIQKALEEYDQLKSIWMISNSQLDEQCAASAKISFLKADDWHLVLQLGVINEGLSQEHREFLELFTIGATVSWLS